MAKDASDTEGTTPGEGTSGPPPRDLYATSDIRFVMLEMGKFTAKIERLIGDVDDQSTKLDDVRQSISFVKGALWVIGFLILALVAIAGWLVSGHRRRVIGAHRIPR